MAFRSAAALSCLGDALTSLRIVSGSAGTRLLNALLVTWPDISEPETGNQSQGYDHSRDVGDGTHDSLPR